MGQLEVFVCLKRLMLDFNIGESSLFCLFTFELMDIIIILYHVRSTKT